MRQHGPQHTVAAHLQCSHSSATRSPRRPEAAIASKKVRSVRGTVCMVAYARTAITVTSRWTRSPFRKTPPFSTFAAPSAKSCGSLSSLTFPGFAGPAISCTPQISWRPFHERRTGSQPDQTLGGGSNCPLAPNHHKSFFRAQTCQLFQLPRIQGAVKPNRKCFGGTI